MPECLKRLFVTPLEVNTPRFGGYDTRLENRDSSPTGFSDQTVRIDTQRNDPGKQRAHSHTENNENVKFCWAILVSFGQ